MKLTTWCLASQHWPRAHILLWEARHTWVQISTPPLGFKFHLYHLGDLGHVTSIYLVSAFYFVNERIMELVVVRTE